MFNKKASDLKNKPDQILRTLALKRGQNIGDIGAEGGYFFLRFAEVVGEEGRKQVRVCLNPKEPINRGVDI